MDVLHPRCAGLDVHKDSVVACVRCVTAPIHREVRSFPTTTSGLLVLAEWLAAHGCTHVAMEATGVYWKPVWHLLEGRFELVLANAQHIRNVPGRKTDVNDATWIADLLAHGLIRSSFVPPARIQALRDLTRTRKQLVREIAQHTLRIQKGLEAANIKLGSVLTNILGKSGRALLAAIIAGEEDPERLAALAVGTARRKHPALVEALRGRATGHHRALLQLHLDLIAAIETALAKVAAAVGEALAPIHAHADTLTTMPGISAVCQRSFNNPQLWSLKSPHLPSQEGDGDDDRTEGIAGTYARGVSTGALGGRTSRAAVPHARRGGVPGRRAGRRGPCLPPAGRA